MPKVVIDGIDYVPSCIISNENVDSRINEALRLLTAMLYFNEEHKMKSHVWEVINELSPDLAKLANESTSLAFDFMHPDYNDEDS